MNLCPSFLLSLSLPLPPSPSFFPLHPFLPIFPTHTTIIALRVFFLDGSHKRSDAIAAISDRLYEFLDWIQTQASYKLFATSLLIIYEGDSNQPIKSPDQLMDVRWVDFAHAYEMECESEHSELNLDENTLFGLKNLIQFLERLK